MNAFSGRLLIAGFVGAARGRLIGFSLPENISF
jgi:hypothetical protein